MSICYLNGEYLPLEQARVPVLDRGFIFGDGVYEVIPAYGGRLFRLPQHLQRLHDSLTAIRIDNPLTDEQWQTLLETLVEKNRAGGDNDQSVYLQVTRGVARRDHGFPKDTRPTVFAMSSPLASADPQQMQAGVAAITLDDIRWRYCHIKTIALLPNVLLKQQALEKGAVEAILVRDGEVTEGSASNIFIVRDGVIRTPAKSERLLPGITRDLIVELARDNGLPCEEGVVREDELHAADEIWLSSSTREILPVTRLDERPVGDGRDGPLWRRMIGIYQDYKQHLRASPPAA